MKKPQFHLLALSLGVLNLGLVSTASAQAVATDATSATPAQMATQAVFPARAMEILGLKSNVVTTNASSVGTPAVETLQDLLKASRDYSLEVTSSVKTAESAALSQSASRRQLMPRLDLNMATGRNQYITTTQPDSPYLTRRDNSLTLRQPIWDYAAMTEVDRRGALSTAAQHDLNSVTLRVGADLVGSYLEVIRNRSAVDINNDYERTLKRLIDYLQRRVTGGAASQSDLDRVRAREENARARTIEAWAGLAAANLAMNRQLGRVPAALQIPVANSMGLPGDAEMAIREAVGSNPELLSGRAQLEALALEGRALKSRYMPKVDFELSQVETRNASGVPNSSSKDIKAMVMMQVNLFASGADRLESKATEARREALQNRVEHAERVLRQDLDLAYSTIMAIGQRMEPTIRELEANARVAKTYDEQLLVGGRTILDLLDAYQRLYESRLALLQLLTSDAQQKYNVARLLGRLQSFPAN